MTPRRPAPARPGARPGARKTSRSPGSDKRSAPSPASAPAGPVQREAEAVAEAPEHTVLRLGGTDGVAVPARIVILALVLLVAFIVTFPSLRGYLAQQAQYDKILDDLAQAKATSAVLEKELQQWQDESYVKAQARERLAYVMPGETIYVVVGADQVSGSQEKGAEGTGEHSARTPWYEVLQESSQVAGGVEETAPDAAQRGWSTAVPTVPTPTAIPTSSSTEEP